MGEYCDSHEHQHEGSCSCGCGCDKSEHGHSHEHGHCHCTEKFLELADEAWREVLKEKIKAKIIAKKGEHMDKLAEIIAVANGAKWKYKISAKTKIHEFKDNLKEFLSSCEE